MKSQDNRTGLRALPLKSMECGFSNPSFIPTVSLGVTYAVAYTYGCDDGRIEPTRCAVIDGGLGDRSRQRRACRRPPARARSARIVLAAASRPASSAAPDEFRRSRTTPPSATTPCGDASLAKWVGSGRVTLRHVSPIPPLDPYVRLAPHTAHDRGILWERSISPAPRYIPHGQLCAFAGYLCTVSRPSPSGPSPCARFSRTRTPLPSLTAWRALEFRMGFPMPTLHPPCHPLQALPCSR